jgi:hypothetical protein
VTNVEKQSLSMDAVEARASQNFLHHGLVISRLPTFAAKAVAFPGSTFVVGADTITRVDSVRFYQGRSSRRDAIAEIADHACKFLVFGRGMNGKFQILENLKIGSDLSRLCEAVEEDEFRSDLSSTKLRLSMKD